MTDIATETVGKCQDCRHWSRNHLLTEFGKCALCVQNPHMGPHSAHSTKGEWDSCSEFLAVHLRPETPFLDKMEKSETRCWPNIVGVSRIFGREGHDSINQVRKYTGEPYWFHTESVAELMAMYGMRPQVVSAALLHDIYEDVVPTKPEYAVRIMNIVGREVVSLVTHMTDVFTKKAYPELNRAQRKVKEAERLVSIPIEAKVIKLGDLYDNGKSIARMDLDFAKTYLEEKRAIVRLFAEVNVDEALDEALVADKIPMEHRGAVRDAYTALLAKVSLL